MDIKSLSASTHPHLVWLGPGWHLERCARVLPHDQDTGGFFLACAQGAWQKLEFASSSGNRFIVPIISYFEAFFTFSFTPVFVCSQVQ